VDLGDAVLFPGLINAHCHLDYTDMLDQVLWHGDFRDWILRITKLKKLWTEDQYVVSINRGLAELARTGTTSVVNIECFPKLVAWLAPTPLRVWWCVELLDLTWSEESVWMVEEAARWLETQPHGGLAPHAPYTTTAPLYRLAARLARERGWLLTTHIAEDHKEVPLVELGVMGPNSLLAHANHLDEAEVKSLAESGASIVHCPRAHGFFRRGTVLWELWRRYDVNVCLGTDSLASNESLDMRAEMQEVTHLPAKEVLAMATVNAAKALNCEEKLGKIAVGGWADLAAVPLDGDPYESVVKSEKPICFSMVGGKVVLQ
jgi:cytosine/adenosine deaminase-related metal-dependent hydrolase